MADIDDDCMSDIEQTPSIDHLPSEERVEDITDIATWPAVRNPNKWRGQARKRMGYKRGAEVMFVHTFRPIKQSMTKLPADLDTKSQNVFPLIQYYMYDNAAASTSRLDALRNILDVASSCYPMGMELYVQLMKQLSKNPVGGSESAGYRLMLGLLQNTPPCAGLGKYIEHFLHGKLREVRADDYTMVKLCIKNVYSRVAQVEHGKHYCVDVVLMDESILKIRVGAETTVLQLQNEVISLLELNKNLHWCIAQATSQSESTKIIHGSSAVVPLISQWNSGARGSGRTSWMVFKRALQPIGEGLDPLRPLDSRLSFEQARREYLAQPLSESRSEAIAIASRLVTFHLSSRAVTIATREGDVEEVPSDVSGAGALECLMPPVSIKLDTRKKWSKSITSSWKEGERFRGMDSMFECYGLLQKTGFFGTSWFVVNEASPTAALLESESSCCERITGETDCRNWVELEIVKNVAANKDKVCYVALGLDNIGFSSANDSAGGVQTWIRFNWGDLDNVSARGRLLSIFFKSEKYGRCLLHLISPDAIGIAYEIDWLAKLVGQRKTKEEGVVTI